MGQEEFSVVSLARDFERDLYGSGVWAVEASQVLRAGQGLAFDSASRSVPLG